MPRQIGAAVSEAGDGARRCRPTAAANVRVAQADCRQQLLRRQTSLATGEAWAGIPLPHLPRFHRPDRKLPSN